MSEEDPREDAPGEGEEAAEEGSHRDAIGDGKEASEEAPHRNAPGEGKETVPQEDERHADLQHLDSHSFPRKQPGAVEEEMALLRFWVDGHLVPRWVYGVSRDRPWCTQWHKHRDAVSMLHAVYRAYQELIDTEVAGMSAPSTWIHHHLLPALAYLRAPQGPFQRCLRSTDKNEHKLPEALPGAATQPRKD